jgi:hypothetical protein
MKNIGLCIGLFSFLLIVSCGKKEETTTETTETNTVETQTVEQDTVEESSKTSIKVSGDGISLDSKDVDVEIKK